MATRQLLTVDEVINCVVSDDEDYDDPDEPMMEGSDDDFWHGVGWQHDGDTFEQMCPSCSASNSSPTSPTHSPPTSPSPSISTQSSPSSQSTSGTCFYCYNITRLMLPCHKQAQILSPPSGLHNWSLWPSQRMIVEESNRYAQQVMGEERYAQWT